jgi:uncharacterized membrane protein
MAASTKYFNIVLKHLRGTLLAGVLVLTPLVATYLVLRLLFNFLKGLVNPLTDLKLFDFVPAGVVTWVAFGLLIIIIYLAGLLGTRMLGGRLVNLVHKVAETIPGVGAVYRMARQASQVVGGSNDGRAHYERVVMVEFPRKGMKTIGLVTGRLEGQNGKPMYMLYIPTAPNPASGFTALVCEDEVTPTDMTVEDAMKLIVSAGTVFPENIAKYESKRPNGKP